jgi:hypothetical protein
MFPDAPTAMELYYVLVQNAPPPPRHVLCERVAAAAGGFWLYRYIPRHNKFIDDGYAKDLGELKYIITQRYGWFEETFLVRGFEKTARLFELSGFLRVVYLTPRETFCTRISGELFSAELRGDKVEYVKRWIDGAEEPKTLEEALRGLSEYAQKVDAWVIFKHGANYAVAYLVYPSP